MMKQQVKVDLLLKVLNIIMINIRAGMTDMADIIILVQNQRNHPKIRKEKTQKGKIILMTIPC